MRLKFVLSILLPASCIGGISQVNNYAYSLSSSGVMINLYGNNTLATKLVDGPEVILRQESDYPWKEGHTFKNQIPGRGNCIARFPDQGPWKK